MRSLPLLFAGALGSAACTGGMHDPSTVEQQNGACLALEGTSFASVDQLECGATPDGIARCNWQLSFATADRFASEFVWTYSDVAEAGRVECHGHDLVATASRRLTGTYDPETQRLTFEGQVYVPVE